MLIVMTLSVLVEPQQHFNSLIFTNGKCLYLKVAAENDTVNYNANNYSQSGSTRKGDTLTVPLMTNTQRHCP